MKFLRKHVFPRFLRVCIGTLLIALAPFQVLAFDAVDPNFKPVIWGPGTVDALAWNPQGFIYVAVRADRVGQQPIASNLLRMTRSGG